MVWILISSQNNPRNCWTMFTCFLGVSPNAKSTFSIISVILFYKNAWVILLTFNVMSFAQTRHLLQSIRCVDVFAIIFQICAGNLQTISQIRSLSPWIWIELSSLFLRFPDSNALSSRFQESSINLIFSIFWMK